MYPLTFTVPLSLILIASAYLFWRYVWFFRNPPREIPDGNTILCPADGRVVYVKQVAPQQPVISQKKGNSFSVNDIVREDLQEARILIGVFMSPFDVHHNRAPVSGRVAFVRHHGARHRNHHMGSMHWRSLLGRFPIYEKSPHIVENERTVTKITGQYNTLPLSCYVIQIAGGSVRGIESRISPGETVKRGDVFGMIRIGSQVDVVITWYKDMTVKVKPGDRVKAGSTIFIE
jgi:phosphatidylserine decarboxylase